MCAWHADAARIVRDILRTVAQCHSRGVIVRDVKPENFLFKDERPDAPLRAIDFGLAEYCTPGEFLTDKVNTRAYWTVPGVLHVGQGMTPHLSDSELS